MLARAGQNGPTRSLLIANGLSLPMINAIVNQGLATLTYEKVVVGSKSIEVAKMQITEAGRMALGREVRRRSKD
jgi:hypothetical protein